jgi:cytochrome c peroxidase
MSKHAANARNTGRSTRSSGLALFLCVLAAASLAYAHSNHGESGTGDGGALVSPSSPALAPGYTGLNFNPPEPGTYQLPRIRKAGGGEVLLDTGESVDLHALLGGGHHTLLSFIYSSCGDVNGCPLATYVLSRLHRAIQEDAELAAAVRLMSLSFDPQNDTPEVMHQYRKTFSRGARNWQFLTTASEEALEPILEAYGQSVNPMYNQKGERTGHFSHVLRVFLIDPEMQVRNIYNVDFLHAEILLADVRTLIMEARNPTARSEDAQEVPDTAAMLMARVQNPPLGLPAVPEPIRNRLDEDKIRVGQRLFHDRRLSSNGTLSCALCHVPSQGFAQNAMARSIGVEGRALRRNAPSLLNAGYQERLFWDGREFDLETLVWSKLLDEKTLGNRAVAEVLSRLREDPALLESFQHAFSGSGITIRTVAEALAAYLGALVSGESRFDRWYFAQQEGLLTDEEVRGFALFTGKAGCARCHRVERDHALFTDQQLHNTGLGWRHSMGQRSTPGTLQVGGQTVTINRAALSGTEERPYNDLGLYEVTQDPDDRWRFRTPSLRDVATTAPYMHDGSLPTLEAVVQYYNAGGTPHALQASSIRPLGLDASEQAALVAFLESLTGQDLSDPPGPKSVGATRGHEDAKGSGRLDVPGRDGISSAHQGLRDRGNPGM